MRIIASTGNDSIARVYLAECGKGRLVEMVESVQPLLPLQKKWVLIVSTLFGCPIRCLMCDAGGDYQGRLSKEEIWSQIDFLVRKKFPEGHIPVEKFKIQFARMGEPSLNPHVLEVLEELPMRYDAPGLIPCLSTIAPAGSEGFFEKLLEIKKRHYGKGRFQLQFSIHTTDARLRNKLMPVRKWTFAQISRYGSEFYQIGEKKAVLNFVFSHQLPLESDLLLKYFSPDRFLIKITPLNPTYTAIQNGLTVCADPSDDDICRATVDKLRGAGYEVILSIGELEENYIGSNCGQYLTKHLKTTDHIANGYSHDIRCHL